MTSWIHWYNLNMGTVVCSRIGSSPPLFIVTNTDPPTCNFWHFSRSYIIRTNNWNGHNHCGAKWWPIPCFSNYCWWAGMPWSIPPFFTDISVSDYCLLWMRKKMKLFVSYYGFVWCYHCTGHKKCRYWIWSVKHPGAKDSWCYCTSKVIMT